MTPENVMAEEPTRRIAIAPVCTVLNLAMAHVPEDYYVAHMSYKQFVKWVNGSKYDPLIRMRLSLHDEVQRAKARFLEWEVLPAQDAKGAPKPAGPLFSFAALRSLENCITAAATGDTGDLAEAIDDLDEIPLRPADQEEKPAKSKGKKVIKVKRNKSETLADMIRSLGDALALRPQAVGQSKAS